MFQWKRLPDADADLTNSADTTETQIGAGIKVPNWARSIKAVRILHRLVTLTTDEEVAGYLRLNNDEETIDPLYLPLPIAQCLTGALGTHHGYEPIVFPLELAVTPNDIVRAYSAYDAATTGVHTMVAYLLFSSNPARFHLHAQKSAVQTQSTSSVTKAAAVATIATIAGKVSGLLGIWGYLVAGGGITAAQSVTGYVKILSDAAGWLEQNIPLNIQPSGLGTQISPNTKPVVAVHRDLLAEFDLQGVTKLPWPDIFPVSVPENFNFYGVMDGGNTAAPTGRFGLIWRR